jgi:site-specific DNA recombinase
MPTTLGSVRLSAGSPTATSGWAGTRAALDADADPVVIAGWMSEVQAERLRAERDIMQAQPTGQYTKEEIRDLVAELSNITSLLAHADPKLKAQLYEELGISVRYDPTKHVARIESRPANPWARVSVGGGT